MLRLWNRYRWLIAILILGMGITVGAIRAQAPGDSKATFYSADIEHSNLGNFRGATETWRGRIQTLKDFKSIGAAFVSCIRIDQSVRNCYANYNLPEGTISAQGVIGNLNRYSLTLVGGTGVYLAYHGWVAVVAIGGSNGNQVAPNGQLIPLHFSILTFHLVAN